MSIVFPRRVEKGNVGPRGAVPRGSQPRTSHPLPSLAYKTTPFLSTNEIPESLGLPTYHKGYLECAVEWRGFVVCEQSPGLKSTYPFRGVVLAGKRMTDIWWAHVKGLHGPAGPC